MAKDVFHDIVIKALKKESWNITDDPLYISVGAIELYIDIGAEKIIGAEKAGEKIAVEIKSFLGSSTIYEFHAALGQYINYRLALNEQDEKRTLYMAIPVDKYTAFFELPFIQTVIESCRVNLIIYDPKKEIIVKWIK